MSKRVSDKTKKPTTSKVVPPPGEAKPSNGSQVPDTLERRRMQNRLAQRNHRKKVRDHINALEARVINSMLQRPSPYGLPIPSPSMMPGPGEQQYNRTLPAADPNFDFALDFSDTIDHIYSLPSGTQSPGSDGPASPQDPFEGLYPTPANSCLSLPLDSHSSSVSGSRASGVTFDLITSFPESQVDPLLLSQMQNSLSLMETSTYHKLRTSSIPELQDDFAMQLFSISPSLAPTTSVPSFPHDHEPIIISQFSPTVPQPSPSEVLSWESQISPVLDGDLLGFEPNRYQSLDFIEEFSTPHTNAYLSPDFVDPNQHQQKHHAVQYSSLSAADKNLFEQMSIYRSPTYF